MGEYSELLFSATFPLLSAPCFASPARWAQWHDTLRVLSTTAHLALPLFRVPTLDSSRHKIADGAYVCQHSQIGNWRSILFLSEFTKLINL